jgi:uncharacterized protein (UPF0210 family)
MNIRSITYFDNPGWPLHRGRLRQAGDFIAAARPAFEAAGYPVQTARLASVPFPRLLRLLPARRRQKSPIPDPAQAEFAARQQLVELAQAMSAGAVPRGFDYISLGPALPEVPESYAAIPGALAAAPQVFLGGMLTDSAGRISLSAVGLCAGIIHQAARLSLDGFANLRFAALANVPAGSPFFPAAYHAGRGAAFVLATEAAGLAVEALTRAATLEAARASLVSAMESHAQALVKTAQHLSDKHGIRFGGIDFSLAPFPDEQRSLGAALERLGVAAVGLHGSLAAAAFLADAMDRARFPRAGFSGLMLPVLEDAALARRAAEGILSVKDLLLLSAVCGAGLDTLPLPGDVSAAALSSVLLDVAALACRLDKPLTARLMPIPGKRPGDSTGFDFAYFANSRVMALDARPLQGLLAGDEAVAITPRFSRHKTRA